MHNFTLTQTSLATTFNESKNSCCPIKVLDNRTYRLHGEEDTEEYGCLDRCTYTLEGENDKKYCFAEGTSDVKCRSRSIRLAVIVKLICYTSYVVLNHIFSCVNDINRVACSVGYTLVCGSSNSRIENDKDMVSSCPNTPDTRKKDESFCSCLPTIIVEDALERNTNPLGKDQAGCVKVEGELILKGLEGLLLNN